MYSNYESLEQLEDELYREEEDNSDESEADSELQFHLYSQLHYSSNVGEVSELEDERKDHTNQDNQNITDSDKLLTLSENKSLVERKKKVEGVKEKKTTKPVKKDKLKNQRASSTWFEEVIVIDSSSDVVTLSDDDCDETEGVCALKGRRLSKICTSTPAQQVKRNAFPVNVSSSDTESESESESQFVVDSRSSSDSDDLENWMILGHGQQDGDQSISLNLEGVAESETDNEELHGRWLISDRDRQAQISNKPQGVRTIVHRVTNRYYTDKNVHCKNCNRTGHLSKNCPEPKKVSPCFLCGSVGHVLRECPYKHCNNCGHPGHLYNSCSERSYWHKQCRRCGMTGHFHDECPEVWRQYHITIKSGPPVIDLRNGQGRTPAYCYNCAKRGHFGHECRRQRMFNGTFPSTPFINHYDTNSDIQLRQNRIQHKAKDLKYAAPLDFGPPCDPQSPSTPGPPRKKQKTSSRSHCRPSFKVDLPASSHIFFSDTSDSIPKKHKPVSLEKPWKPKRPVPQSRDSLPKVKVDLDEEDAFPRGGRQHEEAERRKKGKKMKKNGQSLCWIDGTKQGFSSKQAKNQNVHEKKKKKNKNASNKRFPADENLFIIKQRKPKK